MKYPNPKRKLLINTVTTIIFFNIISNVYSQDILSSDTKKQFLISSQIKLSVPQIISNFKSEDEKWLKEDSFSLPTPFESAYNLNVIDYFEMSGKYHSELQKEVFKQTAQYKTLLDSLKKIKANYLNSVYYATGYAEIGDYDLQKKGFLMKLGEVLPYQCSSFFLPKVYNQVEFKQLPIQKKYNLQSNSDNSYTEYLFIPMDAPTALEMENNDSVICDLWVCEIKGIYTAQYNDADFIKDNHGEICKADVVKGGNLRILIYNKSTGTIYYDKLYTTLDQNVHAPATSNAKVATVVTPPPMNKANSNLKNFTDSGYNLNGRKMLPLVVSDITQKKGVVVIDITVDGNGNVINANYSAQGSTTTNDTLVNLALKSAYKTKFSTANIAEQRGKLTFKFNITTNDSIPK